SPVHDQRVRNRNIETAFDDGRRKEHIIFPVVESAHALLDFRRAQLSMGSDELDLRDLLAEPFFHVWNVGNARPDNEALPASVMFAEQRFAAPDTVERCAVSS